LGHSGFCWISLCVVLQTLYLRSTNCCSRSTKHYILTAKVDKDFARATAFEPDTSFSVLVLLAIPIIFSRHESVRSILSAPIPYKTCASITRKYPQACYLRQHVVNPSQATWKVQTFEKQPKKKFAYKKCFSFSRLLALCLKWFGSFDCKLEIFHTCNLHDYIHITQRRGTKFLRRYFRLHKKPALYTHVTWNIYKKFSFYAKHPTYKDSSITNSYWTKTWFLNENLKNSAK